MTHLTRYFILRYTIFTSFLSLIDNGTYRPFPACSFKYLQHVDGARSLVATY